MLLQFPLQRIFSIKFLPLPPFLTQTRQPALCVTAVCKASSLIKRSSDENMPKIAAPTAVASLLFQEQHIHVSSERPAPLTHASGNHQYQPSSPSLGLHQLKKLLRLTRPVFPNEPGLLKMAFQTGRHPGLPGPGMRWHPNFHLVVTQVAPAATPTLPRADEYLYIAIQSLDSLQKAILREAAVLQEATDKAKDSKSCYLRYALSFL